MFPQHAKRIVKRKQVAEIVGQKLNSLVPLSEEELDLIESCSLRSREYPSGMRLPPQRRPLNGVVVSGWLGRLRLFADGRRQIVSTMMAGELVGPHPNPFISGTPVALTDAWVADLAPLSDAMGAKPQSYLRLREGLTLASRLEELQMAEQIVQLGRRTAFERFAHWLLDLQQRLTLAGQCDGDSFHLPLTQEILSDILGMSIVHVNRILKQLRGERLIRLQDGVITILERESLVMIAEFTPLARSDGLETESGEPARALRTSVR
jgi:CRP-like cAMP-binding protein